MARDILSEYGPDSPANQKPRASSGGVTEAKPLPYSPPQGPTTFSHVGPGLAGHTNYGNCGTQGHYDVHCKTSGSPGLHGDNKGNKGSQRG